MCNLSEGLIERTLESADKQYNKLTCGMILPMMKRLSIDFDSAADILNIPDDKIETYRALVAGLQK